MDSLRNLKKLSRKALIIVAHPDDESLFMGGTIAEFKRWSWTILYITDCDKRYNKRRRRELLKVRRIYTRGGSHVKPSPLGVTKKKGRFSKVEAARRIRNFIDEYGPFDIVFTHNSKGDYGHPTHKLVHEVVRKLRPPNLYNFVTPYKKSIFITSGAKSLRNIQSVDISPKSRCIKRQALNIYLKGSQKTNLARLKRFLTYALNTRREYFKRAN